MSYLEGATLGFSLNLVPPSYFVQPKKFQMDMPDEKDSGMYGIKKDVEEDVVESLALDDNNFKQKSNLPPFGLN